MKNLNYQFRVVNDEFDQFSDLGNCDTVTSLDGGFKNIECGQARLHQIGASIMHKPSGLGIYGLWQREEVDGGVFLEDGLGGLLVHDGDFIRKDIPDTNVWYVKPFWRKTWGAMNGVGLGALGATTFYGEFGRDEDQFGARAGLNFIDTFGCQGVDDAVACFVTGSEVERWGLGVVQEIDAAAMHVWLRWQHQELDVDVTAFDINGDNLGGVGSDVDDFDLFQAGGIIFF